MIAGIVKLEVPGRLVAVLTVLYIGFYPIDYYYISKEFLPTAVHLIFFLGSVMILTAKTLRDFTFVKVIAAMALLAAAVLSISLTFFAFLAVFLLFTIATLSSGEVVRATRLFVSGGESRRALSRSGLRAFPRRLGMLSLGLFAGILFLTGGVFFVLPRTARAAFQRFAPERYHLPGFSNEVTLGEIGEIKQSSTPVMHVYSQGDGFLAVRWRGAALTHFDGKRWFNLPAAEERLRPEGRRVLLLAGASSPGPQNRIRGPPQRHCLGCSSGRRHAREHDHRCPGGLAFVHRNVARAQDQRRGFTIRGLESPRRRNIGVRAAFARRSHGGARAAAAR